MGSVTKRRSPGLFAATKPDSLITLRGILHRGMAAAFMGAIAKWLRSAFAARTPPIFLVFLDIDAIRLLLGDYRFGHDFFPY